MSNSKDLSEKEKSDSNLIQPFDQRDGYIWYNGEIIEWQNAKVHILNHGLHYASSVFEGERAYNGRIFKLKEHTERLIKSAQLLGFELPYSQAELERASKDIVAKQNIQDGYIRPIAWRGSERMAISARKNKIHVAIAAWKWPDYYKDRKQGIKLTFASWKRPSPETIPSQSKAAGLYMICTLSKHEAEDKGYQDAIMLDWRGFVSETTSANIFFIKDGALHTPIADCFLDGITRRTVIDIARANNIDVSERRIMPEEIADFDAVFVTGTAAEVTPVINIDNFTFDVENNILTMLMKEYENMVRNYIE